MDYRKLLERSGSGTRATGAARTVIGWADYGTIPVGEVRNVGGWGGFIERGHRWRDFVETLPPEKVPYFEALRRAIIERALKRGGDWHQNDAEGVPVFDDGAVATFSFRAWGDLLAATWAEHENRDYAYMDFYMDSCPGPAGQARSDRPGTA